MLELPDQPVLSPASAAAVQAAHDEYAAGLPSQVAEVFLNRFQVDIRSEYAGLPIASPFGKASGQLSLNIRQVDRDAEGGLGFCVLKTVIAQDETGVQMMHEWAIQETHMRVERIVGPRTGQEGWTVTWKGRGWYETFEKYLQFFRDSIATSQRTGMVVAPSVKYHLPTPDEPSFKESEYRYTTRALQQVWHETETGPMPLEKDFSPTLAGSNRSQQTAQILTWLQTVPRLIQGNASRPLTLGLKIMNAVFDDEFQLAMVHTAVEQSEPVPDFLIYANRLFDPAKEFEGKVGVAYGGPDLSSRNLAVLERLMAERFSRPLPPISATGDILDGRMALAYGLRGCTSFQMHTLFQLPDREFSGTMSNKTEKVLHHLYLNPQTGLIPWLLHLREQHGLGDGNGVVKVLDLPAYGRALAGG